VFSLASSGQLAKPVLIITITDGEPTDSPKDMVVQVRGCFGAGEGGDDATECGLRVFGGEGVGRTSCEGGGGVSSHHTQ
jgi:hypothetical protein